MHSIKTQALARSFTQNKCLFYLAKSKSTCTEVAVSRHMVAAALNPDESEQSRKTLHVDP